MSDKSLDLCICGHSHETRRREVVYLCLDCECDEKKPRGMVECGNCGAINEEWLRLNGPNDRRYCSRACLLQAEYAEQIKVAA